MARHSYFKFKHFAVAFARSAMRVGTDGVLLGAWCPVEDATRVLDVGTGCGVVALQVAQRAADASILGIDIDEGAVADAKFNFAHSPWSDRLKAQCVDFNDLACADGCFDLIVSNPPFFSNGILPMGQLRGIARHSVTLSCAQLIAGAKRLLTLGGTLAMVTPADARKEVESQCAFAGLNIKQITKVSTTAGMPPKRLLWAITPASCRISCSQLALEHADHSFTQEYIGLCREFYLKM